jgi:phosphoglucomutase
MLAGILAKMNGAPGDDARIGGLKTISNDWFAGRPSRTENI